MERGIISIEKKRVTVVLSPEGSIQMTAEEIASLFYVTTASIERHIKKIFAEQMLYEYEVRTKQMKIFGNRRCVTEYYNLDMVVALSFRIDSDSSKAFRRWLGEQVLQALKTKPLRPIILQIPIHTGKAN